jgi:hypothetical protein
MTVGAHGGIAFADPHHCDRPGWPPCYDVCRQAAISGTPCPSGHSANYCHGWVDANSDGGSSSSSDSGRHDNTPSGLGFRPETTHGGDLDTSATCYFLFVVLLTSTIQDYPS